MIARTLPASALHALALALLCACSGGGGSSTPTTGGPSSSAAFEVSGFSVAAGSELHLNDSFDVFFNADVDFATVGPNTIEVRRTRTLLVPGNAVDVMGEPAVGTYSLVTPGIVRFTPACPTGAQADGAGLLPKSFYTVRVPGTDTSGPTVRSAAGAPVRRSRAVPFRTPQSNDPAVLYSDAVAGPPAVVVRSQGSGQLDATYLELGLDDGKRVYFEDDGAGNVELPLGFLAPINPYSVVDERVAWILQLDQAIRPTAANLAPERVRLEGLDATGTWIALATDVEIDANCAESGARLRLTPRGILPQDSEVRAVLDSGFRDLVGEALGAPLLVAVAPIATSFDPGSTTPGDDADQRFEGFAESSLEDTEALFDVPSATWSGGRLTANTNFSGTGGPNGEFDWYIPANTDLILNTVFDVIVGGPNGVPVYQQTVINGVLDVRDVFLPASSRLIVVGPNSILILAAGEVRIEGEILVNGGNAPGVGTLNTTNVPEPGAPGQGGGGSGGVGSYLTTQSTPRGGAGSGPFGASGGGGEGGETSYSPQGKNDRRGAGGGGGGHASDILYDYDAAGNFVRCQTLTGMDAERGALGGTNGLGAESQSQRAQGGAVGPRLFVDGDDSNDFAGTLATLAGTRVFGELDEALPGAGGGAGGDAVNSDSFPLVPFSNTGDEKGAGGGGGAGRIHVLAVGPIEIADGGGVSARGGHGNGGENTNFFDRVGGGSGAGSGGAIVLESLVSITVRGVAQQAGDGYRDDPNLALHTPRALDVRGGQGGAGHESRGGANENGPSLWRCDRIPFDHFPFPDIPPLTNVCFEAQPDFADLEGGPTVGAGGDGAPGVIQLHVPTLGDLDFPDAGGDLTKVATPPPVGWNVQTGAFDGHLLPSFGWRSAAQTRWIPLGLARHAPTGPDEQVLFAFGGTNAQGLVTAAGGEVVLEPALVGPDLVQSAPNTPYVTADPFTMVFDSTGISGLADAVERNPELLRGSTVRLSLASQPDVLQDFAIVAASYDPSLDRLAVTVDASGDALTDFHPASDVQAELVPRSFQVVSGDQADALLDSASVAITFDATVSDGLGRPDDSQSFSETNGSFTGDITSLNLADWDFVRVRVDFDLNTTGTGNPLVEATAALDFLRVAFRF